LNSVREISIAARWAWRRVFNEVEVGISIDARFEICPRTVVIKSSYMVSVGTCELSAKVEWT
jgi:hypothetical protein